jgi:hypothetical protein
VRYEINRVGDTIDLALHNMLAALIEIKRKKMSLLLQWLSGQVARI